MKSNFFKKNVNFFVVVIFLCLLGLFLYNSNGYRGELEQKDIKYVKIRETILKVELAMTKEEQQQGLSNRNILKNDEGMLFIFEKPNFNYFWMKDMEFSIDIVWIDSNQNIIYLKKNVSPESFPETFGPKSSSSYVLETNAGFIEKNNLKMGDKVKFLP